MARALIVGCGCRGRALAAALQAEGHGVRGTTRDEASLEVIAAVGAEAVIADPNRLSTLTPHLEGMSLLYWLMGTARGEPESLAALHGQRLESLLETLVDTPVRGMVYEAAGTVDAGVLAGGAAHVRQMTDTFRMPSQVVIEDRNPHEAWLRAMTAAAGDVLSA